ncbi:CLUMA_CG021499, isoform A [Clunio marinus]|uniref:CLUMA_CG021499, isoform A n=1 Tax=Clunio marinus TaxID=568069 RepID=A0A1J1J8D1_9DIPT|nr:CLUMA_CG021499, isoform A [Clunio marinus]
MRNVRCFRNSNSLGCEEESFRKYLLKHTSSCNMTFWHRPNDKSIAFCILPHVCCRTEQMLAKYHAMGKRGIPCCYGLNDVSNKT